jgi:delta24-sterol reductase
LKKIEKFCIENSGHVALYGETQLTREEFYDMFNPYYDNYDVIRKKYDCEKAFPHVYEKISKLGRA